MSTMLSITTIGVLLYSAGIADGNTILVIIGLILFSVGIVGAQFVEAGFIMRVKKLEKKPREMEEQKC